VLLASFLLLPEPLLELDCEPAVQPAAIMPAATMTPYLVRRLMPFVLTAVWSSRPCARWPGGEPEAARGAGGDLTRITGARPVPARGAASALVCHLYSVRVAPSANFVRTVDRKSTR